MVEADEMGLSDTCVLVEYLPFQYPFAEILRPGNGMLFIQTTSHSPLRNGCFDGVDALHVAAGKRVLCIDIGHEDFV